MESFLTLGAWEAQGQTFEIASRRKLDSRVVVPFFREQGRVFAGLLRRERASRQVRGEEPLGLEPIGFDFKGVDETADVLTYGEAMFGGRTQLRLDPSGLQIPLPSYARSIGYLTELSLPLLAPVVPPEKLELPVEWDGARHAIVFAPVEEHLAAPGPRSEDVAMLLHALAPPLPRVWQGDAQLPAKPWSADDLAAFVLARESGEGFRRIADPRLRFLRLSQVGKWEVVTPGTGNSFSLLPYAVAQGVPHFLLWHEVRAAALERRERAPLFDLPFAARYANATGFYVRTAAADDVPELLARALGRAVRVRSVEMLGNGEPSPGTSSELRHRAACEIDPPPQLPPDAFFISAPELCRAVSEGRVRDPVVVAGLLQLGFDPFAAARIGDRERRSAFVASMTQGSLVQRRLQGYSSIEQEQLQSRTYARLMTLLQHEYGVRIAYPKNEKDREFFKAAFRVFMAADRGDDDRALQGLHWSHDAFHFALGNFAVPPPPDFNDWYVSGNPAPADAPPEGPEWETYSKALKAAENEATFFSFWTLYDEHFPLARHVGKLTYYEALRELGITDRPRARNIYDAVVDRAELPREVSEHPKYTGAVKGVFEYMLGFRPYHFKDIAIAWKFAVKEPYRGYTARFGIYEKDLGKYLEHVRTFWDRLSKTPPGFNPLLAACADAKVDVHLRVWDVIKALKLVRKASRDAETRRAWLGIAEEFLAPLQAHKEALEKVRAQITDAEITPRNEELLAAVGHERAAIEALRQRLWDRVEATGLFVKTEISGERVRELPR